MIVGLCGRMGSGKDVVGQYLVHKHQYTRYAFADALKQLALYAGWNGVKDEPGRKLLQELGNGAREIISRDVWIQSVYRAMSRAGQSTLDKIVITDVRYHNESKFIRDNGGCLVRICRPDLDRSGSEHQHPSERYVDQIVCDLELWNDGTLDELLMAVDLVVLPYLEQFVDR